MLATRGERKMAKTTPRAKNSAFMKPMQPSEQLARIVGAEPLPRSEVTKKIWAHIKKHKLRNPQKKREILGDDKLQPILGGKKLDMFQMTKAVNKHLKVSSQYRRAISLRFFFLDLPHGAQCFNDLRLDPLA